MPNDVQPRPPSWQRPKRPLLLGLVAGILIVQAALLPIFAVITILLAPDSIVNYNGVDVPMSEVRLKMLAMLVVWFAFAAYTGPGLWRGRTLARNALVALAVVAAFVNLVMGAVNVKYQGSVGLLLAIGYVVGSALIPSAIVVWYLCFKSNVREFFERKSSSISGAA